MDGTVKKDVRSEALKDIRSILNDYEIPEEVREAIAKEVRANYKTIADWQKKADRIAELEEANASLTEKVTALKDGNEEADALRKQVKDYQDAEAQRIAEAQEADRRESFRKSFEEALGERKFANGIVEKAVFDAAYADCTANAGRSAKDAIEAATKDAEGIWVNPQRDPHKMPNPDDVSSKPKRTQAQDTFLSQLFGPLPEK